MFLVGIYRVVLVLACQDIELCGCAHCIVVILPLLVLLLKAQAAIHLHQQRDLVLPATSIA